MKRLVLTSALAITLAAGTAAGDSLAYRGFAGGGPFGNPDLGGLQHPSTLVDPQTGIGEAPVSLEEFQHGNPDMYAGSIPGYLPFAADSGPTLTSLDLFTRGNPDFGFGVDYSLPVVGSDEAEAIAEARGRPPVAASTSAAAAEAGG
jgi:hypothetical protein